MVGAPHVVYNYEADNRMLTAEPENFGAVPYFESMIPKAEDLEAAQWINCILQDTEPLVKPEQ